MCVLVNLLLMKYTIIVFACISCIVTLWKKYIEAIGTITLNMMC